MDKYAGLASLFGPSASTGNPALDKLYGLRPITEEERRRLAEDQDAEVTEEAAPGLSSPDMAAPKSGKGHENLAFARRYLQEAGVPAHVAAGLVGNIMAESGGRTGAVGDAGASVGAFQWQGPRLHGGNGYTGLIPFAQQRGGSPYDLKTQLDYALYELQGPEAAAYKHALATKSPEEAAAAIAQYYERPAGHDYSKRQAYARQYAALGDVPEGTYLDVSQNQNSPAAQLAEQGQPPQIPDNLEPLLLSNGQQAYMEKGMPLDEVAAKLKDQGIDASPLRPFQTPSGQVVYVPHDMDDDEAYAKTLKQQPTLMAKAGMPTPDTKTATAAFKQTLTGGLGQMGTAGGIAAEELGFPETGKAMQEWGRGMEARAKGMFQEPTPEEASWAYRNLGIPLAKGAASIATVAPALAIPGAGGLLAAGALAGAQEYGSIEQQKREAGQEMDRGEALGPAAAIGAINILPFKAVAPFFRLASSEGAIGSSAAVKKLVDEGNIVEAQKKIGGYVDNMLKQAGLAEASGASADIASHLIEKAYMGKELWTPETWDEIKGIVAEGAPTYLTLGAGAGAGIKYTGQTEIERAKELKAEEQAQTEQEQRLEATRAAEIPEEGVTAPEGEVPEPQLRAKREPLEAAIEAPAEEAEVKPYYEQLGLPARGKNVSYIRKALGELNPEDPAHAPAINQVLDQIETADLPRDQVAINALRARTEEVKQYAQQIPETSKIYGDGGPRPQEGEGIEGAPISGERVREGGPEIGVIEKGDETAPLPEIKAEKVEAPTLTEIPEPDRHVVEGAMKRLENSGLAGKIVEPTWSEKFAQAGRDTFAEGRKQDIYGEMINKHGYLRKLFKDQPEYAGGKMRPDLHYSQLAQTGNVITDSLREGFPKVMSDGTVATEKNHSLAPSRIYGRIADVDKTDAFNNALVALRGNSIMQMDAPVRNEIAHHEDAASSLEDYANSIESTDKAKADSARQTANNYRLKAQELEKSLDVPARTWTTEQQAQDALLLKNFDPDIKRETHNVRSLLNKLVDTMHDAGLIDDVKAKEYRDYPDYFPLYKDMPFEEMMQDPYKHREMFFSSMGRVAKEVPKIKQQKRHFHEVLAEQNLIKHIAFITHMVAEHSARKNAVISAERIGAASRIPSKEVGAFKSDPDVVEIRVKGKSEYYRIHDPDLFQAMQTAMPLLNPILNPIKHLTGFSRSAMVMTPKFLFNQLLREPLTATIVGKTGVVTPFDTIKEIGKITLGKSKRYEDLKRRGIISAQDKINDPVEFIKEAEKSAGWSNKVIQNLKKLHEVVDGATRSVIADNAFKDAKSRGFSDEDANNIAAMRARELINFSIQGRNTLMRAARATTPFFGSAIQGLDVLARAAAPRALGKLSKAEAMHARRLFYSRVAAISAYSMATAILMSDNEDYLKNPDRPLNYLIPTGDKDTPFMKWAVPFEAGFFTKTMPETLALLGLGAITKERAAEELKGGAEQLLVPPMPTLYLLQPFIESAANYSFHFKAPIESMEGQPAELRDRRASEMTKAIVTKLKDMGVTIPFMESPDKMEYIARAFGGQFWAFARAAGDSLIKNQPGAAVQPEDTMADNPVYGGIFSRGSKNVAIQDFYKMADSVESIQAAISRAKTEANADMFNKLIQDPENRKTVMASADISKIKNQMAQINTDIRLITESKDPSLTAAEKKRRIDERKDRLEKLAERGMEVARRLKIVE